MTTPDTLHNPETESLTGACLRLLKPYGATTWVVGVSGGVDSLVLLHTLVQVRKQLPIQLVAAYVDHGWRQAPQPELEPLWQQCQHWNVPFVICPTPANTPKTETAAREVRMAAFQAVVQRTQASGVLLAHHADDQWETVLLRLFRGTGPKGLRGIQPTSHLKVNGANLTLLRPFLGFGKDDLLTTAEMFQLRWAEDTTNTDTRHARNALRKEVLPTIEKHFPNVRQQLLHAADLATQHTELAEDAVNTVWAQLWDGSSLDVSSWNQLSPAYQQATLLKLLAQSELPTNHRTIATIAQLLRGPDGPDQTPRQVSIEAPMNSTEAHWVLRVVQNRAMVVPAQTPFPKAQTNSEVIPGLPVKFRLAQLFPTWAGVGPAAADNDDDTNELVTPLADDDAHEDDEVGDETNAATDTTDAATAEDDRQPDNDEADDNDDSDDELLLDDDGESTTTEASSEELAPTSNDDRTNERDNEELVEASAVAVTHQSAHTTRIQVIELPEYNAELEIARLGPEEVIPDVLPGQHSHTIYANLKPLINDTLTIRYRRAGDRIHPLGMMSGMRLKSYLINHGISQAQRHSIPMLVSDHDVLWVVGLGFSELLRVHQRPTHRLTWRPLSSAVTSAAEANNTDQALISAY